jgi:tetratricopeptide (TPR) repeat protein
MAASDGTEAKPRPSPAAAPRPNVGWQAGIRPLLRAIASRLEPARPATAVLPLRLAAEEPLRVAEVVACGQSLLEAGALDEAEELFRALAELASATPAGDVGLARTAARRNNQEEAVAHWDRAIERYADRAEPHWHAARAVLLAELGRWDEVDATIAALPEGSRARAAVLVALARLAMRRHWWADALLRWETLLREAADKADPSWLIDKAAVLLELGCIDEAETIINDVPGAPAPSASWSISRARISVGHRDWRGALGGFEAALAASPTGTKPGVELARAMVLFEMGQLEEAETELRRLSNVPPVQVGAVVSLSQVLLRTGRPEEALRTIDELTPCPDASAGLLGRRLFLQMVLQRLPEARIDFARVLDRTEEPAILATLFEFTPELFDGWSRTANWLKLLDRIDFLEAHRALRATHILCVLRLRVLLALRDYERFLACLDRVADPRHLGVYRAHLLAAAAALRSPVFPDHAKPRVFGIGLARTGTTSLSAALAILGFATVDWTNRLTCELMSDDDLYLFDAFTDTPCCLAFERNFYMFPNAKFIYTRRDPTDWEKSFTGHVKSIYSVSSFAEHRTKMREGAFRHGRAFISQTLALFLNYDNYAEAFHTYDHRVRRFFADKPKERFLEFDIFAGDGWHQLCEFLGRDVPSTPFPWRNRAVTAKRG